MKLMKVVWMSFPLGIFITIVACLFVFWWQEISYSSPYGQAVLINGNLLELYMVYIPFYLFIYFHLSWLFRALLENFV